MVLQSYPKGIVIPIFFSLIGAFIIYFPRDRREEFTKFNDKRIDIYTKIRQNIKEYYLLPPLEEIVKNITTEIILNYSWNSSPISYEDAYDIKEAKEIWRSKWKEIIESIKEFDNGEFIKALYSSKMYKENNKALTSLEKWSREWNRIEGVKRYIKKYGGKVNLGLYSLTVLSFISIPVYIYDSEVVWILWLCLLTLILTLTVYWYKKFSDYRTDYEEIETKYYVRM